MENYYQNFYETLQVAWNTGNGTGYNAYSHYVHDTNNGFVSENIFNKLVLELRNIEKI